MKRSLWKSLLSRKPQGTIRRRDYTLCLEQLEDRCQPSVAVGVYSPIDEVGNNVANPNWGAAPADQPGGAAIQLLRLSPVAYADGISTPSLPYKVNGITVNPSPRTISNDVFNQSPTLYGTPATDINTVDGNGLSDFGYSFGQFMDHDMDLTPDQTGLPVPPGDAAADKDGNDGFPIPADTTNQATAGPDPIGSLEFSRSVYDPTTGTSAGNPRQQTTVITSYLDLSQVYGSSQAVADALRTFSGGLLKTSPGNMLPYDNLTYFTQDQINALNMADSGPLPESSLYAAGDVRANENTELTSLTTLFVRNHNAIATQLATENPVLFGFTSWNDENLYQEARKLNIAEYQNIIYTQYLPALLGPDAPAYTGYNPAVNATIDTEFSTVAFRFGHSMLNNTVERDASNGASVGNVPLAVDFFDPNLVNPNGAIDPYTGLAATDIGAYLKGDADSTSQAVDATAVSSVRDDLFGNGVPGGEDLIARDIWRGRDDGIGTYNQVRIAFGLPAITDTDINETDPVTGTTFTSHGFEQITSNVHVQYELETAYASTIAQGGFAGDIDAFVGGMAEDHTPGSDMGPLFTAILANQFARLENGDQFFYLNESFTYADLAILQQGATLAQIITMNTGVTNLQSNVFIAPGQVADSGFETPSVGTGTYNSFAYNPTGAPWTFSGSAGIAGNGSGFTNGNPNAPAGVQVAFLQETGSFSQTIDLQAGAYSLTFLAAQRGNWNQGGQTFEVLVDNNLVGTITPPSANYTPAQTSTFTVAAGEHTITFQGMDPLGGDNTAFVDEVAVQTAPPPTSPIADDGFEEPYEASDTYYAFQYDPATTPWTFSGSAGISGNGSGFTSGNPNAPEGAQVAFLQETGIFSQNVTLAAGTYSLTFLAAQRGNWNQGGQTFEVLVDGASVGVFTPSTAAYLAFQSANFTVTAGSHTLSFVGLNPAGGDNTAFVDDVLLAAPSAAQTGSFDSPNVGAGSYQSFQYDPTGRAWTFTGSAGVAGNDSGFTSGNPNAPVGAQVAFLQGTGSISTVVNLATAGTFDLSFYAAQRGNWNQGGQTFAVYANGILVGTFTPSSTGYELYQTSFFAADAGPLTITFVGLNPLGGDNTAFIDGVLVN